MDRLLDLIQRVLAKVAEQAKASGQVPEEVDRRTEAKAETHIQTGDQGPGLARTDASLAARLLANAERVANSITDGSSWRSQRLTVAALLM